MEIINNNEIIKVKWCDNFFNRLIGLMFKKDFDYCLCFPRCKSIHTFFMKTKIDVIMTDKNYKVLHIFKNVQPNKIILPKKNVYYTFELKPNIINFNIGDKLNINEKSN